MGVRFGRRRIRFMWRGRRRVRVTCEVGAPTASPPPAAPGWSLGSLHLVMTCVAFLRCTMLRRLARHAPCSLLIAFTRRGVLESSGWIWLYRFSLVCSFERYDSAASALTKSANCIHTTLRTLVVLPNMAVSALSLRLMFLYDAALAGTAVPALRLLITCTRCCVLELSHTAVFSLSLCSFWVF